MCEPVGAMNPSCSVCLLATYLIGRDVDHNLCLAIRFTAVPIAAVVVTAVVAIVVVVHYDAILQHVTPIAATIHHLMHHHRGLLGRCCR